MTLQNTLMYSFWKCKADKIYSIVLEEFRLNWIQLACFALWAESPWNLSFSFVSWSYYFILFFLCVISYGNQMSSCRLDEMNRIIEQIQKGYSSKARHALLLCWVFRKNNKNVYFGLFVTSGRLLITSLALHLFGIYHH